jgi:hypothetical protein
MKSQTANSSSFKKTSSSSTNMPKNIKKQAKIKIENTSRGPFNFIYMCLMVVFKRFVFSPAHVKIGVYIGALLICSVLKDFNIVGKNNFFAYKHNFLNQYVVKLGWLWCLVVLVPFIGMTSAVYTGFNFKYIFQHLSRVGIATFFWFSLTTLFDAIDTNTGRCAHNVIRNKKECKTNNHEWLGFDISGHTFLLMYALLIMLEEVKVFYSWETFHKKLNEKLINDSNENIESLSPTSEYAIERAAYWFKLLTPLIKLNFFVMAILALLYEVMLLSTFLYFHTIMHKLLAAFSAVITWFITYKTWYPNKNILLNPGMPGVNGMV